MSRVVATNMADYKGSIPLKDALAACVGKKISACTVEGSPDEVLEITLEDGKTIRAVGDMGVGVEIYE